MADKYQDEYFSAFEYRITLLGYNGVGKSSLTIRMIRGDFIDEYDATIEDTYRKQTRVDDVPCILDILDTVENPDEYSHLQDRYMRCGQVFMLCYDITNRQTFETIGEFRERVMLTKDLDMPNLVLVGMKHDLEEKRQVSFQEASDLAKKWQISFVETSAVTNHNVHEAFAHAVRQVKQSESLGSQPTRPVSRMLMFTSGRCLMW